MTRFAFTFFALLVQLPLITGSVLAQSVDISGDAMDRPELLAAELLKDDQRIAEAESDLLAPYGNNLFTGGFSNDREDGLNPEYVLQPGDRVSVRIWGATDFNESLVVDPKGNIFLPSVGPIALAGVRNRDLNARVTQAVSTVFTDNVRVYTSLDSSQPVAVFVTGDVATPGRFSGIPSNSVLYFLDRAGGIDALRGSYRDIRILRGGKVLERVDLYEFLRNGVLASTQFRDGDTILVGPRGSSVSVSGDTINPAQFELLEPTATGAEIMSLAKLLPGVSYAGLSGIRNNRPYSAYVPIAEFSSLIVTDGDSVTFRADQHDQVIVVDVEGAHSGPSRFAVPRDTRLQELLDYIEVVPALTNVKAISLRRKSVALRQKAALQESLQRLEARYLTASSQTDQESAIRAQEAQLIGQFVRNARQVEPSGRMVVARDGDIANILLQSGDTITIPSRSDSILLSGEVVVSQAILFEPGMSAREYIDRSGGFSQQALTDKIIIVHANGEVSSGKNPRVRAGDEIIVLPKVPVKNLQIASTIVDILYKIAIAASVAVQL
ncbi:MAG: polysaccharide biosynthesis/export family protein [Granulosicoccus sp.]